MQLHKPKAPAIGLFWLGIQIVWGALLGVSLQARAVELGGTRALAAYGLLAAAGAAIAAITQLTIGVVSDRRRTAGSKRVEFHVAGAIVGAIALLWFYSAPSYAQLVAAVLVLQLGMNIAIGPYQAAIPDFFSDEELDAASSWMAALQSAGNAVGALLASLVSDTRIVASTIAASLLASCAFTVAHIRGLEMPRMERRALRVDRAFTDLFISRAFVFLGFYTLLGYLFFFVRSSVAGATKEATGVLILIVTVSAAAGAIAAARLTARMDRRAVAFAGGAAFICALLAFLASRNMTQLAASALLAGVAWGVFITADWALGCRFLPRHALATAMAVWNLALLAPQILAPVIATALISSLHQAQSAAAPRTAFLAAMCEVAVGIAWIWRLPASQRSVEPATSGNRPKALG